MVNPLEDKILTKYQPYGLRFVKVYPISEQYLPMDALERSDVIHSTIAKEAAKVIDSFFIYSSRDVFGVGSGRGAVNTCFELWKRHKAAIAPRPSDVTVVPLTGYLQAMQWAKGVAILDATEAASFLASACRNATVHVLGLPLAISNFELNSIGVQTAIEFSDAYWLPISPLRWKTIPGLRPRVCIVGVGVLRQGHAMWAELPELEPVKAQLQALKQFIGNGPYVVGDLCNHLFVIEHLAHPQKQDIKRCVDEINRHLLTATPMDHLQHVGLIIIIAGGQEKADAVHHVLRGIIELHKVDKWLITDSFCAGELLKIP